MSMKASPSHRNANRAGLIRFMAWVAVGAGLALGVTSLGIFAVPVALRLAVLLPLRDHAGRAALGILVGRGLLALDVADLQRKGPGTVTWHTATASGSD
jgi:hypothetical protein